MLPRRGPGAPQRTSRSRRAGAQAVARLRRPPTAMRQPRSARTGRAGGRPNPHHAGRRRAHASAPHQLDDLPLRPQGYRRHVLVDSEQKGVRTAMSYPPGPPPLPPSAAPQPPFQPASLPPSTYSAPPQPSSSRQFAEVKTGQSLPVRVIWYLLAGWWATGIAMAVAWFAALTLIGLPLTFW